MVAPRHAVRLFWVQVTARTHGPRASPRRGHLTGTTRVVVGLRVDLRSRSLPARRGRLRSFTGREGRSSRVHPVTRNRGFYLDVRIMRDAVEPNPCT